MTMLDRRRVLLGATAVAAAIAIPSAAVWLRPRDVAVGSKVDEAVIAWLKANALPLATAEPGRGVQDLAQLRSVIGDARVVALGEATHGTREFFTLKHRMIEYCVSQLGFTVIGIEAEHGTALSINDYVVNSKGNAADAVSGMGMWPWDTEEVVALAEWVRDWNLAHERKVKFYGFDMQFATASALHLLAYLERVAPELAATCERSLGRLCSRYAGGADLLSAAERDQVLAQIAAVLEAFAAERARWVSQTGELDWNLTRHSAVVLLQSVKFELFDIEHDFSNAYSFRDRCMAANVRALLDIEGPGAKALLWAHNGHVQRKNLFELVSMGGLLQADLGAEYVAVGFAFNQGSFRATGVDGKMHDHVVGPAPKDSVDGVLAATGIPLLALDLKRVPADGPVARWMVSNPQQRLIGARFDPTLELFNSFGADPRDNFDALLFVETTTTSRGLEHPPRVAALSPASVKDSNAEPTNFAFIERAATPDGWRLTDNSLYPYAVAITDRASPDGGRAVCISRAGSPLPWGDAALTQSFPAAPWRGRRLVFSAAMRAEAPRIGTGATLLVHVWPKQAPGSKTTPNPILAMPADGLVRSADWVRRSVAVDVPQDAERVQISIAVIGGGAGWFGDLALGSEPGAVASWSGTPARPARAGPRTVPVPTELRLWAE